MRFKRGKLDRDAADGLMQPIGDDDAVIYDKYELSKHEVFKILKQKFEALNVQKKTKIRKSKIWLGPLESNLIFSFSDPNLQI